MAKFSVLINEVHAVGYIISAENEKDARQIAEAMKYGDPDDPQASGSVSSTGDEAFVKQMNVMSVDEIK